MDDKRLHRQKVSFSDAEMADLRARARADGRSVADFVYRLVITTSDAPCSCSRHG